MSGIRSTVCYIRFAVIVFAPENPKGDPFVTMKNSPKIVISGIRYIRNCYNRNSLYPFCAKFGMGCFIDSLALFKALKNSPGTLYPVYVTAYKSYKTCHFVCL